ncbi:MAG: urea amidolyase associated protein UAAP1 [Sporichthyaceae bacterium]
MSLLRHEIPGGAALSLLVRGGRELRLTAARAGANCSVLLYAFDRVDRLNVPDTLKAQMSACIRPPMVLMSDRGTALASVTGSSLDWHDAITGHSLDEHAAAHGPSDYQADRNAWRRSARHGFLAELRKHGMDAVDLHACVNFFSKVGVDDAGRLGFVAGHCAAGDWVSLRAEQDLLVVCSTAPHPMDVAWSPASVSVEVNDVAPWGIDDPSVLFRAESARALQAARAVFA